MMLSAVSARLLNGSKDLNFCQACESFRPCEPRFVACIEDTIIKKKVLVTSDEVAISWLVAVVGLCITHGRCALVEFVSCTLMWCVHCTPAGCVPCMFVGCVSCKFVSMYLMTDTLTYMYI